MNVVPVFSRTSLYDQPPASGSLRGENNNIYKMNTYVKSLFGHYCYFEVLLNFSSIRPHGRLLPPTSLLGHSDLFIDFELVVTFHE